MLSSRPSPKPHADTDPFVGTAWLLVREVRSPGNLGTLMRTLAGVGGGGLIFLGDSIDPFDPAVVRAAMGSIFHLKVVRVSDDKFLEFKRRTGCHVVGTSPSAAADYRELRWHPGLILFLGGERRGLSEADDALCDHSVRIPMHPCIDSLNLGVAGSLMLYEAYRHRF